VHLGTQVDCQTKLIRISKPLILLVCHPRPHLGRHERVLSPVALVGPPRLVLPHVVQKQRNRRTPAGNLRGQNGNLGGAILGRIPGLETLRADYRSGRKQSADHGRDKGTLRSTSDVGGSPVPKNGERSGNGVGEVDSGEEAGFVAGGEEGHECAAEDAIILSIQKKEKKDVCRGNERERKKNIRRK